MGMLASIVIRTYNEQRYLQDLLELIEAQEGYGLSHEVIIVDSGSTDRTLDVAARFDCRVVHISKADFSFGRSLNLGCAAAAGDFLVFISGHCVPSDRHWLHNLVDPLSSGAVAMTYGRQLGGPESKFSEIQLFRKFFPAESQIPQVGYFCNNANSALLRSVWQQYQFDEELTGLEDMHLGKRLVSSGLKLGYVADAAVYHYHHEEWSTVRRRYEREAIALQHIMPEVQLSISDVARYFWNAVLLDAGEAHRQRRLLKVLPEIVFFRFAQFWGSYRGNHEHRRLSQRKKEQYFYPRTLPQSVHGPLQSNLEKVTIL